MLSPPADLPRRAEALSTPPRGALNAGLFDPLLRGTGGAIAGVLCGVPYDARVMIPDYHARIIRHYRDIVPSTLHDICARSGIPFGFEQFGLLLQFKNAAEIPLHDEDMVLDPSIRALVARFGPVILQNACIAGGARNRFHRNIFPHLRFHTDRGPNMPNRYSCFTRDPDDAEQQAPRDSSTLFIANIVAWLEGVRNGQVDPIAERGARMSIDLFSEDAAPPLGDVVLEQPWAEPHGTGEIAVIDNATVLHATYNKTDPIKGYRIGARYLT